LIFFIIFTIFVNLATVLRPTVLGFKRRLQLLYVRHQFLKRRNKLRKIRFEFKKLMDELAEKIRKSMEEEHRIELEKKNLKNAESDSIKKA